jgi:hypothetical protein
MPTRAPLCDGCLDAAARDIRSMPRDYRDLAQRLAPGARFLAERPGGGGDPPAPIDLRVDALMREIHHALTVWEPAVREFAGLSPERVGRVRAGFAVLTAARIIAPRTHTLAALPPIACYAEGFGVAPVVRDGIAAVGQLRALHRRARLVLGLTRLVQHLPGECSKCGAAALRRNDGSDTVHCAHCGRSWTYDDYRRYVCLILEAA